MGGGGFSMEPENPLLDEYVISCCESEKPTICFLPTASGDSDFLITKFYTAFNKLNCRPKHLPLFRQPEDLEKEIFESDALYVGGGNTRNMIAIWKSCGLDKILRSAWEKGIVLCGLSAGAICWFEEGHTDSAGSLGAMECLGFLRGSCSPHYDGESDRKPSYHDHLKRGLISEGIALYDGAAAHFVDEELKEVVTSRKESKAFSVTVSNGSVMENEIQTRYLGTVS